MKRTFTFQTLRRILHTAGLGPKTSDSLAKKFVKWDSDNGSSWVIERVKALRSWVISYHAGATVAPQWFKVTKANLPKDPDLREVFRLSLRGAIMVCSIDTLYAPLKKATEKQIQKFLKAVEGPRDWSPNRGLLDSLLSSKALLHEIYGPRPYTGMHKFIPLTVPPISCINSPSIAIGEDKRMLIHPEDKLQQAKAYVASWKGIPKETIEFLGEVGRLDWVPIEAIGNAYQLDLNNSGSSTVGLIAFLQQEEEKLRSVANGNKLVQHTLLPLGRLWYDQVRKNPQDSTFDSSRGVFWVQKQLKEGHCLAGVDMTSATDLLDLDMCLALVNAAFFEDLEDSSLYDTYLRYFKQLSRGEWWSKDLNRKVRWTQGQPLGLYPSFALLTLTNYALAMWACYLSGIPTDSFFCHGDDMIIDQRAMDAYVTLVRSFGGEINLSKTLVSNRIAEFDGKLITPTDWVNKRLYLSHLDDDSFLSFARWFGPKVRQYLQPRQRRVWDELKFVPGIIYGDTYMADSFDQPLALRVEWWETWLSHLSLRPDRELPSTFGESLWKISLLLDMGYDETDLVLPYPIEEWTYQVQDSTLPFRGDPRKWKQGGKTLLQITEGWLSDPYWVPYQEFLKNATCAKQSNV
jgi:hypothetical protein